MCLSIPAKVISIEEDTARVSVGGAESNANIMLLNEVNVGDYVLVHAGFALQVIDEDEAIKTLDLFAELEEFNKDIDKEKK